MNRRWFLLVMLATSIALLLIACGGGETTQEEVVDPLVEQGETLFQTGGESQIGCVTCHTLDGTDLVGPSLQGISERAGSRTDLSAEAYVHQSIVDPSAYLVEGYEDLMNKNYEEILSSEEIDALVAYVLTQ